MGALDRDNDSFDSVLRDGLKNIVVPQYDETKVWQNIKARIEIPQHAYLNVSDRVLADLGLTRNYGPLNHVLPVEWFVYKSALVIM